MYTKFFKIITIVILFVLSYQTLYAQDKTTLRVNSGFAGYYNYHIKNYFVGVVFGVNSFYFDDPISTLGLQFGVNL